MFGEEWRKEGEREGVRAEQPDKRGSDGRAQGGGGSACQGAAERGRRRVPEFESRPTKTTVSVACVTLDTQSLTLAVAALLHQAERRTVVQRGLTRQKQQRRWASAQYRSNEQLA